MMPIVGENQKPKLWGGRSLKSFGLNPYNEPLFRVVWGPSRLILIGAAWQDHIGPIPTDQEIAAAGKDTSLLSVKEEFRWVPKYPEVWVLERWLTPVQYGGPPAVWDRDERESEVKFGPYPNRGEYEECYQFQTEPPYSAVERVIQMLVYGSQYTQAERKQALEAEREGKVWDWKNKCEAIWSDSQGAFNNKPTNVNPAKRTADKVDLSKVANLPQGDGKFFTQ